MARSRGYTKRGAYQFTYRRKAALARAQAISARKRKGSGRGGEGPIKKIGKIAGIAGVVGAGAYLGYRHRATISKTAGNWKNGFSPSAKERTIVANGISNANPSATVAQHTTKITDSARRRAQDTRDRMAWQALPPHMGGPDNRIYNEDGSVNSEAMTNRGVRGTVRRNRRRTQGTKTRSKVSKLTGVKPPSKTTQGFSESEWAAALGFDTKPETPPNVHRPRRA